MKPKIKSKWTWQIFCRSPHGRFAKFNALCPVKAPFLQKVDNVHTKLFQFNNNHPLRN